MLPGSDRLIKFGVLAATHDHLDTGTVPDLKRPVDDFGATASRDWSHGTNCPQRGGAGLSVIDLRSIRYEFGFFAGETTS